MGVWICKGKKIEYGKKTLIMGIVNVTPDSFSDGGDNFVPERALETAVKMERLGADIIDFGAQSTRPNHTPIGEKEEWARLEGVLAEAEQKLNVPVSVDTFYPFVTERALRHGAHIVNDVSGVINPEMGAVVRNFGAGWVVMHNGAGDVNEVREFFKKSAQEIEALGINKSQICFDMGVGFGKTREEDARLIANVEKYKPQGYPLLLGTSRKRVIKEGSGIEEPKKRTPANISADAVAIFGGVDIIRLHDVETERHGIHMADYLKLYKS